MFNLWNRQSIDFMDKALPSHAGRSNGTAMVGVDAADDDSTLRLFHQSPVSADHAQNRIIGLGTGVHQEHPIESRGCKLSQFF